MFKKLKKIYFKKNILQNKKYQEKNHPVAKFTLKTKKDFEKDDLNLLNEIVQNPVTKKSSIFKTQDNRFNEMIMSRDFVDYKYIALQLYTLKELEKDYQFLELSKYVFALMESIEHKLKEEIVISLGEQIFLKTKKIGYDDQQRQLFIVNVVKRPPNNCLIYKIKNLKVEIESLKDYKNCKYVVDNFSKIINQLLNNYYHVKFHNLILFKVKNTYGAIVSKKFMIHSTEYRLDKSMTWQSEPLEERALTRNKNGSTIPKDKNIISKNNFKHKIKKDVDFKTIKVNDNNLNKDVNKIISDNNREYEEIFGDITNNLKINSTSNKQKK